MNFLFIGAHPDDAEFFAGGTMALLVRAGHKVLALSLTNGDIGHHEMGGGMLAQRRVAESQAAATIGGYESLTLDTHDGELMPSLELRKSVARIIRLHNADMVFTHRPNDYHPDHRYTAQVVQDAAYMVMVPSFARILKRYGKTPCFSIFTIPSSIQRPFALMLLFPWKRSWI